MANEFYALMGRMRYITRWGTDAKYLFREYF